VPETQARDTTHLELLVFFFFSSFFPIVTTLMFIRSIQQVEMAMAAAAGVAVAVTIAAQQVLETRHVSSCMGIFFSFFFTIIMFILGPFSTSNSNGSSNGGISSTGLKMTTQRQQ
jgi:MFS family permease